MHLSAFLNSPAQRASISFDSLPDTTRANSIKLAVFQAKKAGAIRGYSLRTHQLTASLRTSPDSTRPIKWPGLESDIQQALDQNVDHNTNQAAHDQLKMDTPQAPREGAIAQKKFLQIGISLTLAAILAVGQPAIAADPSTINTLSHAKDLLISIGAGSGAAAWVKLWSHLNQQGLVDSKLSRKLIHITSAPFFLATWPLYSSSPISRFIAASVPLLQLGRLVLASQNDDSDLANTISRNKSGAELLKGPAIYAGILSLATLAWRESFPAVCAITQMAAGDGMADIAGRHLAPKDGSGRIPWNNDKSIAGTVGYVSAATTATWGMLAWFTSQGLLQTDKPLLPVALTLSIACGLIETLPADEFKVDDNISVPLAAAALGQVLFAGKL